MSSIDNLDIGEIVMEIKLEYGNMTSVCIIEEGNVVKTAKSGSKVNIFLPNGQSVHEVNFGTVAVSKLRFVSQPLVDKGYEIGDLIAHTFVGRQEYKHEHIDYPIILIDNRSIIGKVELVSKESIDNDITKQFYEEWKPIGASLCNDDVLEYQGDNAKWSGGRDMSSVFSQGSTRLVF